MQLGKGGKKRGEESFSHEKREKKKRNIQGEEGGGMTIPDNLNRSEKGKVKSIQRGGKVAVNLSCPPG